MTASWTVYESPLGPLTLLASPTGVAHLRFPGPIGRLEEADRRPRAFVAATEQLDEYFAGDRASFDLDLDVGAGTEFQRQVWRQLERIPYGTTISYTQLAAAIGRPDRARAVGAAVGQTPVPIIIPCHRVVAANGALTGYGGGVDRKRALLDLEARAAAGVQSQPPWAFRQMAL